MSDQPVVEAKNLAKTFRIGFWRKRVAAVENASFEVHRGEVFGIVGPNGAGKTTTIKMLIGLISPDEGEARIMGEPVHRPSARRNLAFLPERPHFYEYLKAEELLSYFGDLYGLDRVTKRKRIPELLELVGLSDAVDKPLRKFSKGMLQRAGLAQALLADTDLIVLDEPQSGLDPLGRKDVRDIILAQRDAGKTIIFCSHILPDVESVCDRVAILTKGVVRRVGPLSDLVDVSGAAVEIVFGLGDEGLEAVRAVLPSVSRSPDGTCLATVPEALTTEEALQTLLNAGASIRSVEKRQAHLEDVFIQEATAS